MYLKDLELTKEDKILRASTNAPSAISVNTAKSRVMRTLEDKKIPYSVASKHLKIIRDVSEDGGKSQISISVKKSFQSLLLDSFELERRYQEAIAKNMTSPRVNKEVELNMHQRSLAYIKAMNNFVDRIYAVDDKDERVFYTLSDSIGVDVIDEIYDRFKENLFYFLYPSNEKLNEKTTKYLEKSGVKVNDLLKSEENCERELLD